MSLTWGYNACLVVLQGGLCFMSQDNPSLTWCLTRLCFMSPAFPSRINERKVSPWEGINHLVYYCPYVVISLRNEISSPSRFRFCMRFFFGKQIPRIFKGNKITLLGYSLSVFNKKTIFKGPEARRHGRSAWRQWKKEKKSARACNRDFFLFFLGGDYPT